ncbi:hypothetical protein VHEMI04301 [[Torrubiella] hemipterigena]|uniref:C5a peptidase/Subtilisin-like protease SBT2-like Fn3-like domain-containing protein n=1 Tax=[Torrubiella] hemipterigena TaxID=1531966 RepID=A0A0A1TDF1_9HYPO|nr:hypothetical protein VHEMI04301 [[Torrubiella] hemipterigena]
MASRMTYDRKFPALEFSDKTLRVSPGGEAMFNVTVKQSTQLNESRFPLYSGWVTLNSTDSPSLSIAYQGVGAKLHSMPLSRGLRVIGVDYEEVGDGYEFSIGRGPVIDFNMHYGSGLTKQSPFKNVASRDWEFWDGTMVDDTNAPEGRYRFVVQMLRFHGDAANKEDWEIKRSTNFIIRYKGN